MVRLRSGVSWVVGQVRRSSFFVLVWVAVGVYAAVYSAILSLRYWAFQTFAWDLGNYNQGMYSATVAHRLFFYTADLPSGNPGSLFATHFSPILVLLVPLYALSPGPTVLLAVQALALALGAIPLYLLARRASLPEIWALLLALAYLLSPILMSIGWYDFHPEAFLPAAVLWAILAYYQGGRWTFVLSWILALSVIETLSPLLLLFAVASLIAVLWRWLRKGETARPPLERAAVATVLPLAWLALAIEASQLVSAGGLGSLSTGYSSAFAVLGPNLSFFSVLPYALSHPAAAAAALAFQGGDKLAYVAVFLTSFAFLPLLGPKRLLLPAAAWFALVSLSNGTSLYQFGDQYSAYPLPFLAAGAAFGLARVRDVWLSRRPIVALDPPPGSRPRGRSRPHVGAGLTAGAVVLAVILTSSLVSPLLPSPSLSYSGVSYGFPSESSHDATLHQIIEIVPPSASILTISPVFPEVSSRTNAYVVPISTSFAPDRTFFATLQGEVNDSTYVLIDYQLDFFSSAIVVQFGNLSSFGLLVEEDGIQLFERGWSSPPLIWVPTVLQLSGADLLPTSHSFIDPRNSTPIGPAITSRPDPPINSLLWTGPFDYALPAGQYSVTFWTNVSSPSYGALVRYDVVTNPLNIGLSSQGDLSGEHSYSFTFSTLPPRIVNLSYVSNPTSTPIVVETNVTETFTWASLWVWSIASWVYANDTLAHLYSVTLTQVSV